MALGGGTAICDIYFYRARQCIEKHMDHFGKLTPEAAGDYILQEIVKQNTEVPNTEAKWKEMAKVVTNALLCTPGAGANFKNWFAQGTCGTGPKC